MMKSFPGNFQSSSSQRLITLWKTRYTTGAEDISSDSESFRRYPLGIAASKAGRKRTVEKLSVKIIKESSHSAAVKTKTLYKQHKILQLDETVDLSRFTIRTVPILLRYYQEQPVLIVKPEESTAKISPQLKFGITEISQLAYSLGEFCKLFTQNFTPQDWLARCFLTSQISFTSASLLKALDPVERAMFIPYTHLLEEYVAIPWWRLCISAGQHDQSSREFRLVERLLPRTREISLKAYDRWSQQFSGYVSARGKLTDINIRHSSLRDFDMFQIFLWVCLLQGSLEAIEKELVIFCICVFKGLGIPWKMTVAGIGFLLEAILMELTFAEKEVANIFIIGMMDLFVVADLPHRKP